MILSAKENSDFHTNNWWLHSGSVRWRVRIDDCWVITTRRLLGDCKREKEGVLCGLIVYDFCAQFRLTSRFHHQIDTGHYNTWPIYNFFFSLRCFASSLLFLVSPFFSFMFQSAKPVGSGWGRQKREKKKITVWGTSSSWHFWNTRRSKPSQFKTLARSSLAPYTHVAFLSCLSFPLSPLYPWVFLQFGRICLCTPRAWECCNSFSADEIRHPTCGNVTAVSHSSNDKLDSRSQFLAGCV